MQRIEIAPRPDWERRVEEVALVYHTSEGRPYWNESAYYAFSAAQVDVLEAATNDLHEMCLAAVQHVIDRGLFARLGIPPHAVPLILRTWDEEPPSIYGRFDFSWDGRGAPKMLEYNADTPTALLEAAVIQWRWRQDRVPERDQFNSIHERLVRTWGELRPHLRGPVLHFASLDEPEDLVTVSYLRDTAEQAGIATRHLPVQAIGFRGDWGTFVDEEERPIDALFKLYPWEWMVHESFGAHLGTAGTEWMEPAWKMVLSNKGILAVLWELFPGHPNLLPAYFEEYLLDGRDYVRKPLLSREGANVSIRRVFEPGFETGGDYGEEGYVFQEYAPLPDFGGVRPVIGSWVIGQEAAGIGIRESDGPVTDNTSRFVPHAIV
jgi:glutathionylspermidine synthase